MIQLDLLDIKYCTPSHRRFHLFREPGALIGDETWDTVCDSLVGENLLGLYWLAKPWNSHKIVHRIAI